MLCSLLFFSLGATLTCQDESCFASYDTVAAMYNIPTTNGYHDSIDFRENGLVTKPKDRSSCSTWAFALTSAAETAVLRSASYLRKRYTNWGISPNKLDLSEQFVLSNTFGAAKYCDPSLPERAASWLWNSGTSWELETNYPLDSSTRYSAWRAGTPLGPSKAIEQIQLFEVFDTINAVNYPAAKDKKTPNVLLYKSTDFDQPIPAAAVENIKRFLSRGLPVLTAMFRKTTGSGDKFSQLNADTIVQTEGGFACEHETDFAGYNDWVQIVGYGKIFINAGYTDVWVAKNAFGTAWGKQGFFYFQMFNNPLCLETLIYGYVPIGFDGKVVTRGNLDQRGTAGYLAEDTKCAIGFGQTHWTDGCNSPTTLANEIYKEKDNMYVAICLSGSVIGTTCVDSCPNYYNLLDNGMWLCQDSCVQVVSGQSARCYDATQCTKGARFTKAGVCAATCTEANTFYFKVEGQALKCMEESQCSYYVYDQSHKGWECVDQCPPRSDYYDIKTCKDTCPYYRLTAAGLKICVLYCYTVQDQTYYVQPSESSECLASCPASHPYYDTGDICRASCPQGVFAISGSILECKLQCTRYYVQSGTQRQCVSTCPDSRPLLIGTQCIQNCKQTDPLREYIQSDGSCWAMCESGVYETRSYYDPVVLGTLTYKFCVSASICAYFNVESAQTRECVSQCAGLYPYIDGQNCLSFCTYYYNSVGGKKTCTSLCASVGLPYYIVKDTPTECLSQCPTSHPYLDGYACYQRCLTGAYTDSKVCMPRCYKYYWVNVTNELSKRCYETCPGTTVVQDSECVFSCPVGSYVSQIDPAAPFGKCETLAAGVYFVETTAGQLLGIQPQQCKYYLAGPAGSKRCYAVCPAPDNFIEWAAWTSTAPRLCQPECNPVQRYYDRPDGTHQCVPDCSEVEPEITAPYEWTKSASERMCVAACKSPQLFLNDAKTACTPTCSTTLYLQDGENYQCVQTAACPAQKNYKVDNPNIVTGVTYTKCLASCDVPYSVAVGDKCEKPAAANPRFKALDGVDATTCISGYYKVPPGFVSGVDKLECSLPCNFYVQNEKTFGLRECVTGGVCNNDTHAPYKFESGHLCLKTCRFYYLDNTNALLPARYFCVVSCPAAYPYYVPSTAAETRCLDGCPQTSSDPGAVPYKFQDTGGVCSQKCSSGYFQLKDALQCMPIKCPLLYMYSPVEKMYECVAACPTSHRYQQGLQCVQQCGTAQVDTSLAFQQPDFSCGQTCESNCYEVISQSLHFFRCVECATCVYYITSLQTGLYECVDSCNASYPYVDGRECKQSCAYYYTDYNTTAGGFIARQCIGGCWQSVLTPYYVLDSTTSQQAECVSYCPSQQRFVEQDGRCVSRCTSATYEGNKILKCLDACLEAQFYYLLADGTKHCVSECQGLYYGQQCVEACPLNTRLSKDEKECLQLQHGLKVAPAVVMFASGTCVLVLITVILAVAVCFQTHKAKVKRAAVEAALQEETKAAQREKKAQRAKEKGKKSKISAPL